MCCVFFFFNDTATTEIYTLSLHDALPISGARHLPFHEARHRPVVGGAPEERLVPSVGPLEVGDRQDRKSTRLNSSHANISYAVFCLKKKKKQIKSGIDLYINNLQLYSTMT